jgi:lysyl-tRNA synthetase class 2
VFFHRQSGFSAATVAVLVRFRAMPSTAIRHIAFRPAEDVLDVEFVNGRVYRYFAVPEGVAHRLAQARSKGSYFNHMIRGRYGYVRLPEWEPVEDPAAGDESVDNPDDTPAVELMPAE